MGHLDPARRHGPDALGSICFLVASELAYADAGHAWLSWRPGSIAGWVQPSTGNVLDAAGANEAGAVSVATG